MNGRGFSKVRLGRLHRALAGHVEHGEVPGVVALVSRRGDTHVEAIGHPRDAIFRISSMSKPITAAAAMSLVEEGKLRFDDPIDRWLPELANRRVLVRDDASIAETIPAQRPITVRDLLTFRLGLGLLLAPPGTLPIQRAMEERGVAVGPPQPQKRHDADTYLRALGELPLVHQPGERWMYNTGADLLGVLVARASGKSFEAVLRERIFEPLGMKDTGFQVSASQRARLPPQLWTGPSGATETYDPPDGQWSAPPRFASGADGLVSTVDDYFAFAEMMMNLGRHHGERVLSRASVELMVTDHLTSEQKRRSSFAPNFFESNGWGFGMSVVTRRDDYPNVGTFGWAGGLGTSWASDPREDLVGIVMTQRAWSASSPPPIIRDFWTLVYQAMED